MSRTVHLTRGNPCLTLAQHRSPPEPNTSSGATPDTQLKLFPATYSRSAYRAAWRFPAATSTSPRHMMPTGGGKRRVGGDDTASKAVGGGRSTTKYGFGRPDMRAPCPMVSSSAPSWDPRSSPVAMSMNLQYEVNSYTPKISYFSPARSRFNVWHRKLREARASFANKAKSHRLGLGKYWKIRKFATIKR